MQFHHVDEASKEFAISAVSKSWEAISAELDKCVLVCANCHGEIHSGMHSKDALVKLLS